MVHAIIIAFAWLARASGWLATALLWLALQSADGQRIQFFKIEEAVSLEAGMSEVIFVLRHRPDRIKTTMRLATGLEDGSWRSNMMYWNGVSSLHDPDDPDLWWRLNGKSFGAAGTSAHWRNERAGWQLYVAEGSVADELARGANGLKRLKDAPDDAVLAIENAACDVLWLDKGDLTFRPEELDTAKIESMAGDDHVLSIGFADDRVWRVSDETPPAVLRSFLTVAGAKAHDREIDLTPYIVEKIRWQGVEVGDGIPARPRPQRD